MVEDDTAVRAALAELLDESGFQVLTASNGYSGLRLASLEQPRVVLLDLALPELSGLEVLRELRARAETRETAIIVVTGNTRWIPEARLAGADLVVEKPFDIEELLAAVHGTIERSPAHRHDEMSVLPVTQPLVRARHAERLRPVRHGPSWGARRRNA